MHQRKEKEINISTLRSTIVSKCFSIQYPFAVNSLVIIMYLKLTRNKLSLEYSVIIHDKVFETHAYHVMHCENIADHLKMKLNDCD